MEFFLFCLCVSFACVGIHISFQNGMIFNFIVPFLERDFADWVRKPLYECLICMGSFWTFFFWVEQIKPISFQLLFAILVVVGMNKIWCAILEHTEYGC